MVYCDFQLENQVLDLGSGDGIEGRGGLVHQQDFRVDGQGAGDAEALLLAAGEAGAGFLLQIVLDLVPERRVLERFLDDFVEGLRSE